MYAFAIVTILSVAGASTSQERLVLDHGLSKMDCLKRFEAYKPIQQVLPDGLSISHLPACTKEKS
ncbi:MAG: hypothetical protein DI537_13925 [Stutzerimonas stutzeri]|nr:MAG: hypothetical protein DI537_13925 [Stutzerimonas stutzeri]